MQPIKQSYLEKMSEERKLRDALTEIRDLCQKTFLTFECQSLAATEIAQMALAPSAQPDQTPVTEADLRASLAAIHFNACRTWYSDKLDTQVKMLAIRDECERCVPALKGLRPK